MKETQLTQVRPGPPAVVIADALPNIVWRARVESIARATGAEFAILPPQNASGNWVKVVRRLTVRLDFEKPAARRVLRSGMSVRARIDTGRERWPLKWFRATFGGRRGDRLQAASTGNGGPGGKPAARRSQ